MTGWGQTGPLASSAGHDINYIGMTGALHAIGRAGSAPVPAEPRRRLRRRCALSRVRYRLRVARNSPLGLRPGHRRCGGRRHCVLARPRARPAGTGALDGRARNQPPRHRRALVRRLRLPRRRLHGCRGVGEKFFVALLDGLGISDHEELRASHRDRTRWPQLRTALTSTFLTRDRDEWAAVFDGVDACCTPVLSSPRPSSIRTRVPGSFTLPLPPPLSTTQPAPAPRFSRTKASMPGTPAPRGEHPRSSCGAWLHVRANRFAAHPESGG